MDIIEISIIPTPYKKEIKIGNIPSIRKSLGKKTSALI